VVEAEEVAESGDQRGKRVCGGSGKNAGGADASDDSATTGVCGKDSYARV
jgi:hypothetical protein